MFFLENVFFEYKRNRVVLDNLSLKVVEGDIIGILGHNGAGKTTLFKLLLGLLKCRSGKMECSVKKNEISYVPEEGGIYTDLSPRDNILFRARINHCEVTNEKIDSLLKEFKLDNRSKDTSVGEWSNGMRKRLAIICSLITSPRLLLLDEPTNGLDPESKKIVIEILQERNKTGTTILINTHDLQLVQQVCNKIIILQNGKKIFMDSVCCEDLEALYFDKVQQFENK